MSIFKTQSNILPINWIDLVDSYDSSELSINNQLISNVLISKITNLKIESLSNTLIQQLINHIIFNESIFNIFDNLPTSLVSEITDEIKKSGEKNWEFSRKLHSLHIEAKAYKNIVKHDYIIQDLKRGKGSCDLAVTKDGEVFNFEVKFKESNDIHLDRIFDIINCYSFLEENEFLRDKFFEINYKKENITDKDIEFILKDIEKFIENKCDTFEEEYLQIFNTEKRRLFIDKQYLNSGFVDNVLENLYSTKRLIQDIFLKDSQHIYKMIEKNKKIKNFKGYLYWDIPLCNSISIEILKLAFDELLTLDFDLYVYIDSWAVKDEFLIKRNN